MKPTTTSSSAGNEFPTRRRAWQACTTCRNRKTRCDAAKPKCSLCVAQNVECIYKDSQQPRIDPTARMLLDRIQELEDRIFSSPLISRRLGREQEEGALTRADRPSQEHQDEQDIAMSNPGSEYETLISGTPRLSAVSWPTVESQRPPPDTANGPDPVLQIPVSLGHTASASHVLNWAVVQQLLADKELDPLPHAHSATDVFVLTTSNDTTSDFPPPESWRLFRDGRLPVPAEAPYEYVDYIHTYFEEVDIFFPLISSTEMMCLLEDVAATERADHDHPLEIPTAHYCLLLLVLCIGSLVHHGTTEILLENSEAQTPLAQRNNKSSSGDLEDQLWRKAQLLLGYISPAITIEAAQCSMLASIYMGAQGRVQDSLHWSHATSIKCAILAKRASLSSLHNNVFSEAFCRLYWIAYIYEGDFVSEISVALPSGIALYEDIVPYPVRETPSKHQQAEGSKPGAEILNPISPFSKRNEDLVAFQISTNAAIRRLLNRVHSMVYDTKEQARVSPSDHAQWLLRITDDFASYHDDIFRNLPGFLLESQSQNLTDTHSSISSPLEHQGLINNPWNVLRLKGRYHACQHIIYRPFVEYALLNRGQLQTHPYRQAFLERCRLCLQACTGFIKVFDVGLANSITCLFATGMATFSYVVILIVARQCAVFRDFLPDDIDMAIVAGKRNLRRYSESVDEFWWHLQVLDNLDTASMRHIDL